MILQIDITDFFKNAGMIDYAASAAEIGQDAGAVTWKAALEDSEHWVMLKTEQERELFRNYIRSTGGWDADEIARFSDTELNALCIQFVAGWVREGLLDEGIMEDGEITDDDWQTYYARAQNGEINGDLYRDDNCKVWATLSE